MPNELVFFDLETTGLEPSTSEILEIAAQITDLEGNPISPHFESLVKPNRPIPLKINRISGIDSEMAKDAPGLAAVAAKFKEYVGNRPLVGHNSKSFDRKFLDYHFPRVGVGAPDQDYFDTLELAFMVFPIRKSLSEASLVEELLGKTEIHRAWSDTEYLICLYRELTRRLQAKPEAWHHHFAILADGVGWDWSFLLRRPNPGTKAGQLEFHKPVVRSNSEDDSGFDEAPISIDVDNIKNAFETGGLVRKVRGDDFRPRFGQVQMALEVSDSINIGKHQAIEAGTGLGKSYAYLIPLIEYAEVNDEPVVVSTHTKLLQDQLKQDLEKVKQINGIEFSVLKGIGNYLCLKKWEDLKRNPVGELATFASTDPQPLFRKLMPMFLENWRWQTRIGDFGDEIPYIVQVNFEKRWERNISIEEDCPGKSCSHYKNCFAHSARQEARQKKIIVTNHALTIRNHLGVGGLLPPHRVLVIDEAHHLDQVATDELTLEFDRKGLEDLLESIGDGKKGDLGKLATLITAPGKAEEASVELVKAKEAVRLSGSIFFSQELTTWIIRHLEKEEDGGESYSTKSMLVDDAVRKEKAWPAILTNLGKLLDDLNVLFQRISYYLNASSQATEQGDEESSFAARRIGNLRNLIDEAIRLLKAFSESRPEDVCYFEVWSPDNRISYLTLKVAPLNAAVALSKELYEKKHSICLVSATIGASSKSRPLMPMMIRTGWNLLPNPGVWKPFKIFKSPFDYKKCMKIDVCDPGAEYDYAADQGKSFFEAINRKLPELLTQLGGRALVLCTAYSHIDRLFSATEKALEAQNIAVYRQQKNESTRVVVERFKEDMSSCLFGTLGVWEGMDVPGESLSHVIIIKMPFDHPDNPLTRARMDRFEVFTSLVPSGDKKGVNKLSHFYYPLMLIKLRQGAGRLIRHETDKGELIFLDTRIKTRNKGAFWTYIQNSFYGRPEEKQDSLF